jgi:hypothetical protein
VSSHPRTYRFGDASPPGVLLGLPLRQATPVIGGIVWLAACLQTPLGAPVGILGLLAGVVVAFGRWRGSPLFDIAVPATRLTLNAGPGRRCWYHPPLLGRSDEPTDAALPPPLTGLELVDAHDVAGDMAGTWPVGMAVVRDRRRHTLTAAVPVTGRGFPLASSEDQDQLLAGWGSALSPLARDRSPVVRLAWHAWSGPADLNGHHEFLATTGASTRAAGDGATDDGAVADYLALVADQTPATRTHRVVVALTIDDRRVRRRSPGPRLASAIETLADELGRLRQRLDVAGLTAGTPLSAAELSALVRLRSDPSRARQLATLTRSLAAAAGCGSVEWGPMTVEPAWGHVRVDGSWHRTYRVAGWPQLPVPADWLSGLFGETTATRTVCVVMEPIPLTRSARAADREAMARVADADSKARRGFRATAVDRKRLDRVEQREQELAEGHAEFRFTGLVDVAAPDPDRLDEACAAIEQAGAQSLIDLRPLDARHDRAWVACLPLGRDIASRGVPR